MPGRHGAQPGGQQPVEVGQPPANLIDGQHSHSRRRQLDRQRKPVQPLTNLGHRRLVVLVEGELRICSRGALGEQRHGVIPRHLLQGVTCAPIRQRQGRHGQCRFAANAQGLPAGREDSHVRTALQHPQSQLHACVEQLLAVIEQQEQPALGQVLHQDVEWRTRCLLLQSQRGGHAVRQKCRVLQLVQLDEPHTVVELSPHGLRHPQGEPSLADATHPHQRHQPRGRQLRLGLGHLILAVDEARQLRGQVPFVASKAGGNDRAHVRLTSESHSKRPPPPPHARG